MKKFLNVFLNTILFLLIALGILVAFSALPITDKYNIYTVQSGSMEPTIKTGSLIFTRDTNDYQVGDIVTRKSQDGETTVTHRIIRVEDEDSPVYITKGDANSDEDSEPVRESEIIGEVFFKIPYLGYPVSFAKTTPGLILIIIIPAVIIIYDELQKIQKEIAKKIDYRKRMKKRKENKQEKSDDQIDDSDSKTDADSKND